MPSPAQRPVGRPRDASVDAAILGATQAELAERGYGGLTVAGVAARAGVGKAAIYRRYATKQEMIFAAVADGVGDWELPDAGSLEADLRAIAEAIGGRLGEAAPDVLSGLLADVYSDAALAARFSERFLADQRAVVTIALERAVARDELAELPDPLTAQALLIGPIFAWLLILDGDPGRISELAAIVASAAVAGLGGAVSG